jgi:alpha-D-ribose 1-methylphosphonate 5-triphosphate synthase subunit PhnL
VASDSLTPLLEVCELTKRFHRHLLDGRVLEVCELTKRFHRHLLDGRVLEAFTGISFTVAPGELFLISGVSGAGKTSILKCIYRTYLATIGHIWFDSLLFGRLDMATAPEPMVIQLRERELGYCSQFLKVLPRVSALDVVSEPLLRSGLARDAARDQAANWLRRLHISESHWMASPLTFSGGEQQRVNLARAFIGHPRLLLLDEPTASLDAISKEIVIESIAEAKAEGVTIITVSHDREALVGIADAEFSLR